MQVKLCLLNQVLQSSRWQIINYNYQIIIIITIKYNNYNNYNYIIQQLSVFVFHPFTERQWVCIFEQFDFGKHFFKFWFGLTVMNEPLWITFAFTNQNLLLSSEYLSGCPREFSRLLKSVYTASHFYNITYWHYLGKEMNHQKSPRRQCPCCLTGNLCFQTWLCEQWIVITRCVFPATQQSRFIFILTCHENHWLLSTSLPATFLSSFLHALPQLKRPPLHVPAQTRRLRVAPHHGCYFD